MESNKYLQKMKICIHVVMLHSVLQHYNLAKKNQDTLFAISLNNQNLVFVKII